jgi:transposase
MAKTRRQFSAEFRREAVQAAMKPGSSIAQVSKQLDISDSLLGMWVRKFRSGGWEEAPGKELKTTAATELERVKRELARVKMERDILKKALGYFAKDPA